MEPGNLRVCTPCLCPPPPASWVAAGRGCETLGCTDVFPLPSLCLPLSTTKRKRGSWELAYSGGLLSLCCCFSLLPRKNGNADREPSQFINFQLSNVPRREQSCPQTRSAPALGREDGEGSGLSLSADRQGIKNSLPALTCWRGGPYSVHRLRAWCVAEPLPPPWRGRSPETGEGISPCEWRSSFNKTAVQRKGPPLDSTPPRTPSRMSWPFALPPRTPPSLTVVGHLSGG